MFMKCLETKHFYTIQLLAYRLKTPIIMVPAFHQIAISTKPKYFLTFCLYFLDSMDHRQYPSNFSKNSSKNQVFKNFNMLLTPRKAFGFDTPRKKGG